VRLRSRLVRAGLLAVAAIALAGRVAARQAQPQTQAYEPAVYRAGGLPVLPTSAVGGGDVWLDVTVDARGSVAKVTPLRSTPPFTDLFAQAVRGWAFRPARDLGMAAPSHVLVAALVRPPALTVPSTLGSPAQDLASPRADLCMPVTTIMPVQTPMAQRSGVVLVEARVDTQGRVTRVAVVRSAAPFDTAATDAASKWTFTPAHLRDALIPSVVYLAFGFPELVTGPAPH
jgi:TonB family protein